MNIITSTNIVNGVIEVARAKQEEYIENNSAYFSDITKEQKTKVIRLSQELLNEMADIPGVQKMFLNYDSEVCLLESHIEEDHYLSGFVDGFKYLSKIMKDGGMVQ